LTATRPPNDFVKFSTFSISPPCYIHSGTKIGQMKSRRHAFWLACKGQLMTMRSRFGSLRFRDAIVVFACRLKVPP
jgi:hypothetical protein